MLWLSQSVQALDAISLTMDKIAVEGWALDDVELSLTDLTHSPQQLRAKINKLSLPAPLNDLHFVQLDCLALQWGDGAINCGKGRAKLKTQYLSSPLADFTFAIDQHRSEMQFTHVKFGGGIMTVSATTEGREWALNADAKGVAVHFLRRFIPNQYELKQGAVNFSLHTEGTASGVTDLKLRLELNRFTGQRQDGDIAAENVALKFFFKAHKVDKVWNWLGRIEFGQGALYIAPLYLEAPADDIVLNVSGLWQDRAKPIEIIHLSYEHPDAGKIIGAGWVTHKPEFKLTKGDVYLTASHLKTFQEIYLQPFLTESDWAGIALEGQLNAHLRLIQQSLTDVDLEFTNLNVKDPKGRIKVQEGKGSVNWSNGQDQVEASLVSWEHFQIYDLPLGAAGLTFLAREKSIRLLKPSKIPLLDGFFEIEKFDWQAQFDTDPEVHFVGTVDNISLEKLSLAFGWTPLTGTISGKIPGVNYQNKKLSLDGELKVNVFDGAVFIKELASEGLLSDFPKLYSEIEIENLDLDLLTQKLKIGNIKGRLSGFVRELYLENWQPVGFFAWLGTPKGDDSEHKISQKAVENLTSVGGGGAAGMLSRTFLGMFDNFSYDQLGIGCYLHDGVCQLTGVEAAQQGYYIVKGGGLPRIDVMGYNPRVDWNVLLERLARITASDDVVIE